MLPGEKCDNGWEDATTNKTMGLQDQSLGLLRELPLYGILEPLYDAGISTWPEDRPILNGSQELCGRTATVMRMAELLSAFTEWGIPDSNARTSPFRTGVVRVPAVNSMWPSNTCTVIGPGAL